MFTHRGLSGPAILQISSYWREGDSVFIDCLPGTDINDWLAHVRDTQPKQLLATLLKSRLPKRFIETVAGTWFDNVAVGGLSNSTITTLVQRFGAWEFKPGGTEGYRTAEVTLGGINTDEISSKTFEVKKVPGLFAIGEAVDVTGWLGGYNFQWAWASGYCCAMHLVSEQATA